MTRLDQSRPFIDSHNAFEVPEKPELHFSYHDCDCCRTYAGGVRCTIEAYDRASERNKTYEVCPECIYLEWFGEFPK